MKDERGTMNWETCVLLGGGCPTLRRTLCYGGQADAWRPTDAFGACLCSGIR